MNKPDAIKTMNDYGRRRIPFLFIIDFAQINPVVIPLSEAENRGIMFDINGFKNTRGNIISAGKFSLVKKPIPFKKYSVAFNRVQKHLNNGDTYLLNLTFPTKIKIDLSLFGIFVRSRAKYKLLFKNKFVVFSPETFVQINDGNISSNPMKGTIDATIKNARKIIMKDPKETAEHNNIVDLIRNDLSIVAKNVRVDKFRYLEKIKTNEKELYQVSSRIVGKLSRFYRSVLGDIIFSLLPAGSVSGAPKKKTVEIIRSVEDYDRGYYTGVFGYFDGDNLDSGVMIRFIENDNGNYVYKSGGGITALSNIRSEYREMIDKVYVPLG